MKPKYNSIKGRKLQTYLRNKLLKVFPHLKENDIDVAKTGENDGSEFYTGGVKLVTMQVIGGKITAYVQQNVK